jgi:hypothetical protein
VVDTRRSDFLELTNAVAAHDLPRAARSAKELGLSEAGFAERQGGVWGLIIVIAIAAP